MPMQYTEMFKDKRKMKMFAFSYSCSKHRLWVHVITASPRRFKLVPTILCFGAKDKTNRYTPAYPSFAFDGIHIFHEMFS